MSSPQRERRTDNSSGRPTSGSGTDGRPNAIRWVWSDSAISSHGTQQVLPPLSHSTRNGHWMGGGVRKLAAEGLPHRFDAHMSHPALHHPGSAPAGPFKQVHRVQAAHQACGSPTGSAPAGSRCMREIHPAPPTRDWHASLPRVPEQVLCFSAVLRKSCRCEVLRPVALAVSQRPTTSSSDWPDGRIGALAPVHERPGRGGRDGCGRW